MKDSSASAAAALLGVLAMALDESETGDILDKGYSDSRFFTLSEQNKMNDKKNPDGFWHDEY